MQSILGNTRKHDIAFYRSGRIDISVRVAEPLHLTRGDVIDVTMDDKEQLFIYVKYRAKVKNGRHEATVIPTNKRGNHFRTYSKRLCEAILKIAGASDKLRLCVGPAQDSPFGTLLPLIIKYHL